MYFSNFKFCLTLFPKSFSPFPHGTCSLPILRCYMSSDENYHLFCTSIPRSTTLQKHVVCTKQKMIHGAITRIGTFPTRLTPPLCWHETFTSQFEVSDFIFQYEQVILHSPLLQVLFNFISSANLYA